MPTAAVARHTTPPHACPVLTGDARAEYDASVAAAKDFARAVGHFLEGHEPHARVAWVQTAIQTSRTLFQPWVMEILYTMAVQRESRFNELQGLLGCSSRTLSDKLKVLQDEGWVERTVYDEQPVRVVYTLSKEGREITALTGPLFARLNLDAVERNAA